MRKVLFLLCTTMFASIGCMDIKYDRTESDLLRYSSVAHKIFKTKEKLYFVSDRAGDEWSVDTPNWYVEQAAAKFVGDKVPIHSGDFLCGVMDVGTYFSVDKIIYYSSFEMSYDRIYGRLLSGPHMGKLVKVSNLFVFDDFKSPNAPRIPKEKYIEEVNLK